MNKLDIVQRRGLAAAAATSSPPRGELGLAASNRRVNAVLLVDAVHHVAHLVVVAVRDAVLMDLVLVGKSAQVFGLGLPGHVAQPVSVNAAGLAHSLLLCGTPLQERRNGVLGRPRLGSLAVSVQRSRAAVLRLELPHLFLKVFFFRGRQGTGRRRSCRRRLFLLLFEQQKAGARVSAGAVVDAIGSVALGADALALIVVSVEEGVNVVQEGGGRALLGVAHGLLAVRRVRHIIGQGAASIAVAVLDKLAADVRIPAVVVGSRGVHGIVVAGLVAVGPRAGSDVFPDLRVAVVLVVGPAELHDVGLVSAALILLEPVGQHFADILGTVAHGVLEEVVDDAREARKDVGSGLGEVLGEHEAGPADARHDVGHVRGD